MADDVMAHLAQLVSVDQSRSVVLEPTLPSAASPHGVHHDVLTLTLSGCASVTRSLQTHEKGGSL